MDKIKLNFYRFDEKLTVADLRVSVGVDDVGLSTGAKKVEAGLNDITKAISKTVEANDSLAASSASTGNKLVDLANGALTRYRNAFSQMKSLMKSDIASPKYKIQAQTNIDKAQLGGLDSMTGSSMTSKDTNKVLGMANTILKQNSAEYDRQTKLIQAQIAAEDALLAQEKAKKDAIQELSIAMGQVNEQKKGAFGTGATGAVDTETVALTKMDTALEKLVGTGAKFNTTNKDMLARFNSLNSATTQSKSFWESYSMAMDRVTAKTEQMGNKFSTTFGKLKQAAITWRIMYGAFQQIWNILANTVEQAAAYEEALNLYTVALGEYAEQGSEWANKISSALYLDPKLVMQYTGALYNLVQGLGVGSKAAYVMGTNLTQLAYDMSSYLNIDVQSAYDKLQSAITGQSRAVASAGIAMQMASLQELAYQLGIKKTVSEMTQAEKTYLRYIQIIRSTTNMQGDLARTIVTPENALRVVRQQFNLLARSIGQVFIPIIMRAIPYVMALTQILRELAASLGAKLGYKIADIDYSSLKTVDTAVEDMNKKISVGTGKTTKGVNSGIKSVKNNVKDLKDSVNSTLASFDDLNVVMSKNKNDGTGGTGGTGGGGVGGIGGIGGGGSILPDLEKFVDGYDMLDGLTDQFSKNIDKARQNLKTFANIMKVILGLFAAWKLLKHINNVVKFAQGLRTAWTEGTGLVGALRSLTTRFMEGYVGAGKFAGGGLKAITAGFKSMLGPIGQVVVTLGTSITAFFAGKKAMQEWDGTAKGMALNITKAAIEIGALTAAAALFVGSGGAMVTAIAGITGGLIGLGMTLEEYMNKEERQKKYDKLFDGLGISIHSVVDYFQGASSKIVSFTNEIDSLNSEVDKTSTSVDDAYEAFIDLQREISSGAFTDSKKEVEKLNTTTEKLKTAINNNRDAQINYHNTVLSNLREQKIITKQDYDDMTKRMRDYYTEHALLESEYAEEMRKATTDLANKNITQEQYNKKVEELNNKMLGVVSSTHNASKEFGYMGESILDGINLEKPETLKKAIDDIKRINEETTVAIGKQKDAYDESYNSAMLEAKMLNDDLITKVGSYDKLNKKQKETYDNNIKHMEDLTKEHEGNLKYIDQQTTTMGNQYKDFMSTIYGEIVDAGMLGDKQIADSVKDIQDELGKVAEFDTTNAAVKTFSNWQKGLTKEGKKFEYNQVAAFTKMGIKFDDEFANALISQDAKNQMAVQKNLSIGLEKTYNKAFQGTMKAITPTVEKVGADTVAGICRGQDKSQGKLKDSTNKLAKTGVDTYKAFTGTHSPSKLFEGFGKNHVEGLRDGITKNSSIVTKALDGLVKSMQNKMKNVKLSMNFNTDMSSSFNKVLNKLETFISRWRKAINNALSETKKSLDSISTNKSGKISYTPFSPISVPKFAEGGYPTRGDLFFANENGMPEYITSLGGRTAVVNQEQMVQALTNAIVEGLSGMNTGNNGDVVVYLGNELIYKGMAKYRQRENNRYGTTIA